MGPGNEGEAPVPVRRPGQSSVYSDEEDNSPRTEHQVRETGSHVRGAGYRIRGSYLLIC